MAKINLLPWRAERRKARQQEFLTMLGIAAVAAVLISLLIVLYYNGQIDGQNNRNKYLTDQIALLNTQIAEIKLLDEKKAGLLRRKMWSYPASMWVLGAFVVYQCYRYTQTHSPWLIALTVLDIAVIILVWHEWRARQKVGFATWPVTR